MASVNDNTSKLSYNGESSYEFQSQPFTVTESSTELISNTEQQEPIRVTGKEKLQSWLNKSIKIEMSDGRTLIGNFLCTDRDANVILGACTEFLNPEMCGISDEPRILGLVMVPGRHIVSMYLEVPTALEAK